MSASHSSAPNNMELESKQTHPTLLKFKLFQQQVEYFIGVPLDMIDDKQLLEEHKKVSTLYFTLNEAFTSWMIKAERELVSPAEQGAFKMIIDCFCKLGLEKYKSVLDTYPRLDKKENLLRFSSCAQSCEMLKQEIDAYKIVNEEKLTQGKNNFFKSNYQKISLRLALELYEMVGQAVSGADMLYINSKLHSEPPRQLYLSASSTLNALTTRLGIYVPADLQYNLSYWVNVLDLVFKKDQAESGDYLNAYGWLPSHRRSEDMINWQPKIDQAALTQALILAVEKAKPQAQARLETPPVNLTKEQTRDHNYKCF